MINKCIFLITTLALTSCATYSKQDCANFSWDKRGYISALNGQKKEYGLLHYYRACNDKHGIKPQDQLFKTGYDRGLKAFCTPEYADKFAKRGGEYIGTCTKEQENDFLKPYAKGVNQFYKNRVYDLERQIDRLENEVSSLRHDKSRLEHGLTNCRAGY